MNDTAVTIYASLIFLMVYPGIRVSAASIESHEDAVVTSFSRGDYKALADSLESMITEHPLEPISVLHYGTLVRMAELFGPGLIEKTAFTVKEKLRNSSGDDAGSCLVKLNCELERMLYRTKGARGALITDELKPVRKWTLYGPYHGYGAADIDFQFQPELLASNREISPQKRVTITESDGWLDPGKYLFPDHGVAYALVSFRTRRPVRIRLYCNSSYKVFINGRDVIRNVYHGRRNMRMIRVRSRRDITVTVKMIGSTFERMRMLVTDEHNEIIEPEILSGSFFRDECDAIEELDYPFDALKKEASINPELGNRHLGQFFDELESEEAARYYKRSVSKHKNKFTIFLLANSLLDRFRGDRGSAGYNQGLTIINDLIDQQMYFVPARQKKVEHYIRTGDFLQAYKEGRRLVSTKPKNPYSLAVYLVSLNALGYEKEFEETVALARKEFPDFVQVIEAEAEYNKKRDRRKFISSSQELVKRDFSGPRVRCLLREHISRGEYQQAQNLIHTYNFNNDFNGELVEVLIKMGDLKAARSLLLKLLVVHESPSFYYSLGLIDMLQDEDPAMYLQKLIQLQPSFFPISDYTNYLENNGLENPFRQFLDRMEPIGASLLNKDFGRTPSTILYRGRIFLLKKDGSSRVYCEDIVHVGNEEGVRRWGDIRIPYQGRIRPVHMSVYDDKGKRMDLYTMQNVRGNQYVSINPLEKNSIIHLSYIVDNPITTYSGSSFFSLPLEYLHHHDEPVHRVSIKVIAPDGMMVNFLFKNKVVIKINSIEGHQVHEAIIENIPAIKKEPFSGGRQNCLHYFSFSTMDGFSDFTSWYRGLLMRKEAPHRLPASRFKKDTLEKTIDAVYNFVSREIEPQKNVMYLPDSAENTLFRKSGTPEDKVILAQNLLTRLGISSYIAFARNRFLPGGGTCVYPEYFTHMLLCVPLDVNNALWLDFSSRYLRCGVTACAVAGANALVLLHNSFQLRRVPSLDERSTICRYNIVLDDDGSAICDIEAAFIDTKGEMRSYFSNPLQREESVYRLFSRSVPGFSMDSFRVQNFKESESPFIIAAKGAGTGLSISDSTRMILQPVMNKCEVYDYIALPVRDHPLVIEKIIDEKETYRYTLPPHYEKQEIKRTLTLKKRFGSCRVIITKNSGSSVLEVNKEIHINAMVIEPIDYNEFVNFCLELKRIENETVILIKK